MKVRLLVSAVVIASVLTGCYVVPVAPRPPVAIVAPVPPPPGVIVVAPAYPAPAAGYAWAWHPQFRLFGWYHPRYGWHRLR